MVLFSNSILWPLLKNSNSFYSCWWCGKEGRWDISFDLLFHFNSGILLMLQGRWRKTWGSCCLLTVSSPSTMWLLFLFLWSVWTGDLNLAHLTCPLSLWSQCSLEKSCLSWQKNRKSLIPSCLPTTLTLPAFMPELPHRLVWKPDFESTPAILPLQALFSHCVFSLTTICYLLQQLKRARHPALPARLPHLAGLSNL